MGKRQRQRQRERQRTITRKALKATGIEGFVANVVADSIFAGGDTTLLKTVNKIASSGEPGTVPVAVAKAILARLEQEAADGAPLMEKVEIVGEPPMSRIAVIGKLQKLINENEALREEADRLRSTSPDVISPREIIASLDDAIQSGKIRHVFSAEDRKSVAVLTEKYQNRLMVMAGARIFNSQGRAYLPFEDYFFDHETWSEAVSLDEEHYRKTHRVLADICYRMFFHGPYLTTCVIAIRDSPFKGFDRIGLMYLGYREGQWNFIATRVIPYDMNASRALRETFGGKRLLADTNIGDLPFIGFSLLRLHGGYRYVNTPSSPRTPSEKNGTLATEATEPNPVKVVYVNKIETIRPQSEQPSSSHHAPGAPKSPHDRSPTRGFRWTGKRGTPERQKILVPIKGAKIKGGAEAAPYRINMVKLANPIDEKTLSKDRGCLTV